MIRARILRTAKITFIPEDIILISTFLRASKHNHDNVERDLLASIPAYSFLHAKLLSATSAMRFLCNTASHVRTIAWRAISPNGSLGQLEV
jgi:hypothetical protein